MLLIRSAKFWYLRGCYPEVFRKEGVFKKFLQSLMENENAPKSLSNIVAGLQLPDLLKDRLLLSCIYSNLAKILKTLFL